MTTPPALPPDEYSLYVLALSKQTTLAALVDALAAVLGPLQMVELVAVPAVKVIPAPDPWWWSLKAGDTVTANAEGIGIMFQSGQLRQRGKRGQAYTVWEPCIDKEKKQICVFNGPAIPGGLWVNSIDVDRAG